MQATEDKLESLLSTCIETIIKQRGCDLFLYAGSIVNGYEENVIAQVSSLGKRRENAVLYLDTFGGHADAAYKIARAFQRSYKKFTVLISSHCKSAGTLLCTGADEICMGDNGELGPLDVQLPKEGEFSGRRSGLEISDTLNALQQESLKLMRQHFLDLRMGSGTQITTKDALKNATRLVCGLLSPVYEQISPLSLGEAARSNLIALHYGKRLSMKRSTMHPNALSKLITGYPSHGFVIDREEAAELFINVSEFGPCEELLALLLARKYEELAERSTPLITCLSDQYNFSLKSEEPQNDDQPESAAASPSGDEFPEGEDSGSGHGERGASNDSGEPEPAAGSAGSR